MAEVIKYKHIETKITRKQTHRNSINSKKLVGNAVLRKEKLKKVIKQDKYNCQN